MFGIKFAEYIERKSELIKEKYCRKLLYRLIKKYNLEEVVCMPNENKLYNPYQGTTLPLIMALDKSGVLNNKDRIMDVGCGTGIFLIALSELGYNNLYGIEVNRETYKLCQSNFKKYSEKTKIPKISVLCCDAIETPIPDDINCFYLANPFYDSESYTKWLNNLSASLKRNPRPVKLLVYFPTVASTSALRACSMLKFSTSVICQQQVCWRCMRIDVYTNT